MKKLFLLALLTVVVQLSMNAQDIITKADGSRVEAKIEEITEEIIRYHRFDNLNGPIYTVPVTSVSSITFENGTVHAFNAAPVVPATQPATAPMEQTAAVPQARGITQQGYASDAQLMKMAGFDEIKKLRSKANKLKKAAIIGGGTLVVAAGIVYGKSLLEDYFYGGEKAAVYGLLSAGVICGAGFGIASYLTYKRANKLEYESVSLLEGNLYEAKNTRFSAGLNMLANHHAKNNAIGLGLKLTF